MATFSLFVTIKQREGICDCFDIYAEINKCFCQYWTARWEEKNRRRKKAEHCHEKWSWKKTERKRGMHLSWPMTQILERREELLWLQTP